MPRLTRWIAASLPLGLLIVLLALLVNAPQLAVIAQPASPTPMLSPHLGLTFISSAQEPADEARYQVGLWSGAGWNRWPLYWQEVERVPGSFDWSGYDRVVQADLEHGFQLDVILLSRPAFRADGDSIAGLYEPIFDDNTDLPGPGKRINPRNVWADFVARSVVRYRPGGELAAQLGWPADRGVRYWEVWNEPDFPFFWSAGEAVYARLLQVAYLTIKYYDPGAQVLFGGLAYPNPEADDWFARALQYIVALPDARSHNLFFDILPVHNYSYAARTAFILDWAKDRMREVGAQDHALWLNESGVAIWDDYPGPTWVTQPHERVMRATMIEQASFIIQSAVLAWANGVDVVFHHQLFDDCGNQAQGTDFPPHAGELCQGDFQCWGDAFGLFRNTRGAICFSQHPQPGTPRPGAQAFRTLALVFGHEPFELVSVERDGPNREVMLVSFYRPNTQERIEVVWNRTGRPYSYSLDAPNGWATLYDVTGTERVIWAEDDTYTLLLPPATNQNNEHLREGDDYMIDGAPFVLVEYDPSYLATLTTRPTDTPSPTPPPAPTLVPSAAPEATATPTPRATAQPGVNGPPVPWIEPLPPESPATFRVVWGADDPSGIERYIVWVRLDGGDWSPWQETARTEAYYVGAPGHRYDFAVWALDNDGNWSLNTRLEAMTSTVVVSPQ